MHLHSRLAEKLSVFNELDLTDVLRLVKRSLRAPMKELTIARITDLQMSYENIYFRMKYEKFLLA